MPHWFKAITDFALPNRNPFRPGRARYKCFKDSPKPDLNAMLAAALAPRPDSRAAGSRADYQTDATPTLILAGGPSIRSGACVRVRGQGPDRDCPWLLVEPAWN